MSVPQTYQLNSGGVHKNVRMSSGRRRNGTRASAAFAICSLAATLGAPSAGAATPQHTSSPVHVSAGGSVVDLSVYTDQPRQLGFESYQKLHPNVHFSYTIESAGASTANLTLVSRTLLDNRIGSGWPDIAFEGNFDNLAEEYRPNVSYPLDISRYVPQSVLKGYSSAAISICQQGGQLYCLRNDSAQNVFWYNAPLMKKFGYKVPQTWQQYQALGEEVAKQHPGYFVGDIESRYGLDGYFWASECPAQQLVGNNTVKVDTTAPGCVRMAKLLDPLVKDGVLLTSNPFGSTFPKQASHLLMWEGADWFGTFLFDAALHLPARTWAAALPLSWGPGGKRWTGDEGGGVYMISKHIPKSLIPTAMKVIEWMATSTSPKAFQAHATTYPAYGPAAKEWAAAGEAGLANYYYGNPEPVFQEAEHLIWPGFSYVAIDYEDAFNNTMTEAAANGKTLLSELPKWGSYVANLCRVAGYRVVS